MAVRKDLLSHSALSGVTRLHHFDEMENRFHLEAVQDVEPIIEANKVQRNEDTGRFGEMTRVASIPLVIYERLMNEGVISPDGDVTDQRRLNAWLNDPDNRAFRTKEGML